MSHYMETMQNVDQKEEIVRSALVANGRPDIGTPVVYICRPGEGRAGKAEAPAIIHGHESDGESCEVMVLYDVDDMGMRPNVREVSEDQPWPAWRHLKTRDEEKHDPTRLNHIRRDVDEARERLDEMNMALYGGWERPEKAFVELFVIFEKQLKDFGKRLQALERAPPT